MKKGKPLLVEGRLKLDSWEDKNTKQKVSKLKVVLESFSFIDGARGDAGGGVAEAPRSSRPVPPPPPSPSSPPPSDPSDSEPPQEDDVPF